MKAYLRPRRERGIALPVMLIILVIMLVSGVYLLKTVHGTALTAGNLSYDQTLSRAADLGLHRGFEWLRDTAAANKVALNSDNVANGYVAWIGDTNPRNDAFWNNSVTINGDDGTRVEYVIHRMCNEAKPYTQTQCMLTMPNTATLGNQVPIGVSLGSSSPAYAGAPLLHYVITARIAGAGSKRGASVTNQMVVQIGA